jgi:7-carboxy-7-deazaguanine synthase
VTDSLKVSELFVSLQGEGPSLGQPCVFLRLAGCNLHCSFCDTKYTWDFQTYRYEDEVRVRPVADVASEIAASGQPRLVLTGGEPLIQRRGLERLLALLPSTLVVEVETNGTFLPGEALAARVDQWNVSPKLRSAGDPEDARIVRGALSALVATDRAHFKFVLEQPDEATEALSLCADLGVPNSRVSFMPQATTRDELRARAPSISREALTRGVRYSTRLHVELWDGQRGV